MGSSRGTASRAMGSSSRGTAALSTEGISSRDTEADMEDRLRAGMVGISSSRLRRRDMGWGPVGERRWGWGEDCWVGCCLVKRWMGVMEVVMGATGVGVMEVEVEVMMVEEEGETSKLAE